jgi:hypothetical protein
MYSDIVNNANGIVPVKNYNIYIFLLIAILNIPVLTEHSGTWFIYNGNMYVLHVSMIHRFREASSPEVQEKGIIFDRRYTVVWLFYNKSYVFLLINLMFDMLGTVHVK